MNPVKCPIESRGIGLAGEFQPSIPMPARILVVEDNESNLQLVTYLLSASHYTVFTAMDGERGLQVARRERPDLILCDVHLPKLDGFEVARQIRGDPQFSEVPIIAVTACAMLDDQKKVLAAGFDGYITKPIIPEEFVSRTEEFLRTHLRSANQGRNETPLHVQPAPEPIGARATILAVDDVRVNLDLVRSTLEPCGYKVIAVQTVKEAIRLARQNPPHLILSDLHIPETSGYEFLAAVKEDPALRVIPFVLMSSSAANQAALAEGLALGATRVLFRPLEPEVLLRIVDRCLRDQHRVG